MIGIYKIICTVNNKIYIGSSKDIIKRFKRHLTFLRNNKHFNEHLQNAYNLYGETNFTVEVIEECSLEDLHKQEEFWIKETNCLDKNIGFNKKESAEGGTTISGENHYLYGKHLDENVKEKISKSKMGRGCGQDHWTKKNPELAKKISLDRKLKSEFKKIERLLKKKENRKPLGWQNVGSKNHNAKLTEDVVKEIKFNLINGEKPSVVADKFKISRQTISGIIHKRTWNHVI